MMEDVVAAAAASEMIEYEAARVLRKPSLYPISSLLNVMIISHCSLMMSQLGSSVRTMKKILVAVAAAPLGAADGATALRLGICIECACLRLYSRLPSALLRCHMRASRCA